MDEEIAAFIALTRNDGKGQHKSRWVPAFAGMTNWRISSRDDHYNRTKRRTVARALFTEKARGCPIRTEHTKETANRTRQHKIPRLRIKSAMTDVRRGEHSSAALDTLLLKEVPAAPPDTLLYY